MNQTTYSASGLRLDYDKPMTMAEIEAEKQAATQAAQEPGILETIGENLKEVLPAVGEGLVDAFNANADLIYSGLKYASEQAIDSSSPDAQFLDRQSPVRISKPQWLETDTALGNIVSGITQFGSEFVSLGKLKWAKAAAASNSKVVRYGADMLRGAIADTTAFSGREANLTGELMEAVPALRGVLPEWLANDGSDPHITARLKNALEGAGLGVAVDGIIQGLRYSRAAMKSKNGEELANNIAKELEIEAKETPVQPEEPAVPSATPKVDAEAPKPETQTEAPQAAPAPETVHPGEAAAALGKSADAIISMADPVKAANSVMEKVGKGVKTFADLGEEEIMCVQKAAENDMSFARDLIDHANFNNWANHSARGRAMLVGISEKLSAQFDKATPQKWSELRTGARQIMRETGIDAQKMVSDIYRITGDMKLASMYSIQLRSMLSGLSTNLYDLAQRVRLSEGAANLTDEQLKDRAEFISVFKSLQSLYMAERDMGTAAGRMLNARKAMLDPSSMRYYDPNKAKKGIGKRLIEKDGTVSLDALTMLDAMPQEPSDIVRYLADNKISDERLIKVAAEVLKAGNDPAKMFKQVRVLAAPTWTKQLNYYFTQNILTGPITHAFNLGSSLVRAEVGAFGRIFGAALTSAKQLDTREMKYALIYFGHLHGSFWDALQMSGSYLRTGVSGLTPNQGRQALTRYLDADLETFMPTSLENFQYLLSKGDPENITPSKNFMAHALAFLTAPARMNSRVMGTEDELIRQMGFRASMREQIARRLDEMKLEGEERILMAESLQNDYFDDHCLVNMKNPDAAQAYKNAQELTFSQDTECETIERMAAAVNSSFYLKMVVPFIRTVWNVMGDGIQYTPLLNLLSPKYRADLAAGGVRRQVAMGKMAVGTMVIMHFWEMCQQGLITGAFPSNQKAREALERTGAKPYSIKVGDTWVSYQRLDPVATPLGIIANIVYYMNNEGAEGTEDPLTMFMSCLGPVTDVITDKAFLSGVVDISKAVLDDNATPQKKAAYVTKQLNSLMPAGNFFNQLARGGNAVRNITSKNYLDNIIADSPYAKLWRRMNGTVETRPVNYDWMTGLPRTSNYFWSEGHQNKRKAAVLEHIEPMATKLLGPPSRTFKGVKLTDEQYSERCRINGTIKLGGKDMLEAIADLIESPQYQKYYTRYEEVVTGGENDYCAFRIGAIIKRYREAADRVFLNKDKLLQQDVRTARIKASQKKVPPRPESGIQGLKEAFNM